MALVEINFDGIVGPSHNYAGLSLGNLAATANAGSIAFPRAAALQGVEKMRHNLRLGLAQGVPAPASTGPTAHWLDALGTDLDERRRRSARRRLLGLGDVGGQCGDRLPRAGHGGRPLPPHRRQSAHDGASQPRMAGDAGAAPLAFADAGHFAVHAPVPAHVRRRGRGQSYAAVRGATTRRAWRSSSTACAAAPSPRASMSRPRARSPG